MRGDRAALLRRLGDRAVLDVDPKTATPRMLGKLGGALTGPSAAAPRSAALAYVKANLPALGLTGGDLATLAATPQTSTTASGITQLRWRQSAGGIPAADSDLRVNVARDGSVLSVQGSPAHDLQTATTTPRLDAGEAIRVVQDSVGVYHATPVASGPSGPTRATRFRDGSSASLVLVERPKGARLVWSVTYDASADAVYAATVDAANGELLTRVNKVKSDSDGLVWQRYPGALLGGGAQTVDLTAPGWLPAGATTLDGPYAHVSSDVNDDDVVQPSEEVDAVGGDFSFPLQATTSSGLGCDATHQCGWDGTTAGWQANRAQNAVQAFYYVNLYRDHLAAAPISFGSADHAFEGATKLQVDTDDGAATSSGLPDADHVDNANMYTAPIGQPPRMQMYLFSHSHGYREVNGGDDAAIVFHEYTHGLSGRLVTDALGIDALDDAQSGALSEAWSDWYAEDFLVDEFPSLDSAADGEVDMGEYTDVSAHIRSQPIDCSVGSPVPACANGTPAGNGGYTYGDFGRVAGTPEVHADGEIWGETLWDVRKALGSQKAEQLITDGLRLTPPEPSFLDARNAILSADTADFGGADVAALWSIFAARGMGFFASTSDGDDVHPVQDFQLPPGPGAAQGTIAGTVTSAETNEPLAGVDVTIPNAFTAAGAPVDATTGADGRYTLGGVVAASYPALRFTLPGRDGLSQAVTVASGGTTAADVRLRRDWAATAGGATLVSSNHEEYGPSFGCGAAGTLDGSLAKGWSADNLTTGNVLTVRPQMVVRLPQAVDVGEFAVDAAATCGDTAADGTAAYTIETTAAASCASGWSMSASVNAAPAAGGLTSLTPAAGTSAGVTCVRLTLIGAVGGLSANFIDFTELEVHSAAAPAPTPTPTATPTGTPTPTPTATATPSATPAATPTPPAGRATPTPTPHKAATPAKLTLSRRGAVTVKCSAACSVSGTLRLTGATRRRLGLKSATAATLKGRLKRAGTLKPKLKLARGVAAALKRHHLRSLPGTLKLTVKTTGARSVTARRAVTVKR